MSEQEGVAQGKVCCMWFLSRGGLAVHKCNKEKAMEYGATGGFSSQGSIECRVCGRSFRRQNDLKRHKCCD